MKSSQSSIRIAVAYAANAVFLFQCFGISNSYQAALGTSGIPQAYNWGSSLVNIACLALIALLHAKGERLFAKRETLVAAGILCTSGCLVSGLATTDGVVFAIAYLFSILATGCGTTLLFLIISLEFLRLEQKQAIVVLFASFFLALAANSVFSFAKGTLALITVSLLPMVVVGLLSFDPSPLPDGTFSANRCHGETKPLGNLLVKLTAFTLVFSFVSGAIKGLYVNGQPTWDAHMALTLLLGTFMVVGFSAAIMFLSRKIDAVVVYHAVFFVTIVCLVVLAENSSNINAVFAIQRIAGELFRCLLFIFCLKLSARTTYSPIAVFGYVFAFSKTITLGVGVLFSIEPTLQSIDAGALTFAGLCLIVLINFTYLFVFNEGDVANLMETNHVMTTREANDVRCAALAQKSELSEREEQVLRLYSQGKTLKVIANELCLSENTVSMYRRKLYAKLDVHSKQELLALLEQEE